MNLRPASFWAQMQLVLLRLLAIVLTLVDNLFNVHWGERLLERMTQRWQTQIAQLNDAIARLEQERSKLHVQSEVLALHAAALYLGGRILAHDELRFDPANPRDEEMLDATIELLVKQRLATIEMEESKAGHYVYRLEPDWMAIHARLAGAADQADPEIADWFREGLRFIDEAFLSKTQPGTE